MNLPDDALDLPGSIVLLHTNGGRALLEPHERGCVMTYWSAGREVPAWTRIFPVPPRQRADELLQYDTWKEQLPDPRLARKARLERYRELLVEAQRRFHDLDEPYPSPTAVKILLEVVADLVEDQIFDS